jgi:hypothetical protein
MKPRATAARRERVVGFWMGVAAGWASVVLMLRLYERRAKSRYSFEDDSKKSKCNGSVVELS